MEITTRAFRQLAAGVDGQHHAAMATIHEDLREVHQATTGRPLAAGRRRFLRNAGVGGAMLTVGSTLSPISRLMPAAWAQEVLEDGDLAAFAEGLELAAVAIYAAVIETGQLDSTDAEAASLFEGHHEDYAAELGDLAGEAATGEANQTVIEEFVTRVDEAADQDELLQVILDLENDLAATYFYGLGVFDDLELAALVATILPIESQHAVVLGQALGQDMTEYVPTFQGQDGALSPTEYPVNS